MTHELRAESGSDGTVLKWHVVRDSESTAMCGREIAADAAREPESKWGTGLRGCQQCGSLYMHEAPHYPGDPHR